MGSIPDTECVAVYLRKSRAEENEPTDEVLERHRVILTDYARKHGIGIQRIYEEVVSGDSLFSRPVMMELLHDIQAGKYTGLMCVDIDRLGRGNMREQGLILDTLKEAGTVIITPEKVYDLNDEIDETQTEFKTFFARQELKMIKKRLNRGRMMTLEKGGYVSNPPFGYSQAYRDKIPTLAPDPEESGFVKLIFSRCLDGEGCQSISNRLNCMGAKPRRGGNFSRSTVREILSNPVYTGKTVWGRSKTIRPSNPGEYPRRVSLPPDQWHVFPGLHPAIIDEKTFHAANRLLAGRSVPPASRNTEIKNPLAGLLFCRKCGYSMVRRPSSRNPGRAEYICPSQGCVRASRTDLVEEAALSVLWEYLKGTPPPDTPGSEDEKAAGHTGSLLKSALSKLKGQLEKACAMLEQGVYSPELFSAREQDLKAKMRQLEEDIEEQRKKSDNDSAVVNSYHPTHLLEEYRNGTPIEKNQMLKAVIDRIYYYKAKTASPNDFCIELVLRHLV